MNFNGLNLEIKITLQKSPSIVKRIEQGFVKCFSEFAKGIYETFGCNFFNIAIVIVAVFLILQFILFLCFAGNNQERTVENFWVPGEVKFFLSQCDLMQIQF